MRRAMIFIAFLGIAAAAVAVRTAGETTPKPFPPLAMKVVAAPITDEEVNAAATEPQEGGVASRDQFGS
jgi:hypothetical protein